jgi:predicted HTH transcriptional regulator
MMKEIKDSKIFDFQCYIDGLVNRHETFDLEFKSGMGGFPGSFWDTYSAFANSQGGTIVLGVKEKDDATIIVEGLSQELITKYKKDFWNSVNNKDTVNINLLKEEDVMEGNYNGSLLLVFHIPRAKREQMPVYRTTNPYNGTFKRNNEGDYKCTEHEVRRMFADADSTTPRDSRILKNFSLEDIDLNSLRHYRQLFSTANPIHPWLALDDLSLLKKLGGYRRDRITKEEGFTLAGLLMFGKYESIIDNECLPDYFVDYRIIPEDATTVRWIDRIYPDGTWEANLFQFYQRALPKLTSILPKPFKLENNIRIENSPTHIAVREALINALVHSDYTSDSSIVIEQRKDSFSFSNPGNMLISIYQYYNGGESVCRNKSLQKMFMLIGSAEKAGSGVDKILSGWKEASWKKPYVSELHRPDKVILYLPMKSLLPQDIIDELTNLFGREIKSIGYDKLVALSICFSEKSITNDRLQYITPKHSTEITKLLKELCNSGFLISRGVGRGTKYNLNLASSEDNLANSEDNLASSEDNLARSKRLSRDKLEELIINECKDYLSLDELAKRINKNNTYLKDSILPDMIKSNKIERLYPATPRHPNQKYKAK